jgi:hypothetical protein
VIVGGPDGYGFASGMAGNVLLAFSVDGEESRWRPRPVCHHKSMRWLFALLYATAAFAQNVREMDAREIIAKSVQRDYLNFERLQDYTYTQRNQERTLDKQGRVQKTETETYDVLILGGHDYEKLIARDDKPLPEKEARKEQDKMDKEIARREHESDAEKAKLEKERRERRKFLNEVPDAFNFTLVGVEQVSGKPAWVISAEPKPGYQAKERLAKIVEHLRGKVWIDQAEYQWVKVEAQAAGALSFGFGLLKIEPGAALRFEQTRVNDDVWLPASASIHADARAAFLKHIRSEVDMHFQGYKKFQADSTFVPLQ